MIAQMKNSTIEYFIFSIQGMINIDFYEAVVLIRLYVLGCKEPQSAFLSPSLSSRI